MTITSESFTSTSGNWDAASNWSQDGVPDTSTTVAIGPAVSLVVAGGNDVFAQLDLAGSTAGGGHNTLDVTHALIDPNSNAGVQQITDFTVDVASGATFQAPDIASFSGSVLDDFGSVSVGDQYGGGGITNVSNATFIVETGGTLSGTEITEVSGSTIDIMGVASLTGGGGLEGLSNDAITIAAGGSFTAQEIANVANSSFDVEGDLNLTGNGGITNLSGSNISIGSHGVLTANQIQGSASDTLIVNGDLTFNRPGAGDGLNGAQVTINHGGTVTVEGYDSSGQPYVLNGGTYIGTDPYSTDSFNFGGVAGGIVDLQDNNNANSSGYTISNFTKGDSLLLGDYAGIDPLTVSLAGSVLSITDGGTTLTQDNHFSLAPGETASDLHATVVDGQLDLVACFCAGTRILTERGEVAVEDMEISDKVLTWAGAKVPVIWLGNWQVDLDSALQPEKLRPVRIAAGALGDNVPSRDLYVSPDHAMYLDDALVPAHLLVNGKTITQPARRGVVTYYHVQVEPHDILIAEHAATESFLDLGCTGFVKPGEEPRSWEDACAPLLLAGPQLARIQAMVERRAAALAGDLLAA